MRANRKRDTLPERRLRSLLHSRGYRFRVHLAVKVSGRTVHPDIAFSRQRVAVFVDGCYWHSCAEHGTSPQANQSYWGPKLERNVLRDREADRLLTAAKWSVVRVWEHLAAEEAMARVEKVLSKFRLMSLGK